jgi:cysteine desulfurase
VGPVARIYLDHAATTPVLPEARAAMAEALARWANPSSPHAEGRAAKAALEEARRRIAAALDWHGVVIFTSGASEALAIALGRAKAGPRFRSPLEHDAVLRACPAAIELGLHANGTVSLDRVCGERPLVAVQHANNETGLVQPLADIASEMRARGGLLLADCAQSAGKLPLPSADFIALSAHKFGGPPGVGALLVRDLGDLSPCGGQEQGYRSGTENLPAILAMTAALEAGAGWMAEAGRLRARLEAALTGAGAEVVASDAPRIPTIGAYRMPGVSAQAQLVRFDMAGIAVSAGSACSSGSLKPSRVLAALGWPEPAAAEVIRVSFGRTTTEAEVDRFAALWADMASRRRAA